MPRAKTGLVLTGIRKIDRRLKTLEPRVQRKVARKAVRNGIKVVARELKAKAPVDTGILKSAIEVRVPKKKKRYSIEIEVRINPMWTRRRAASGKSYFYPAGVEFGTHEHAPNPFGRRAYQSKGGEARKEIIASMKAGIDREVQRGP